MEALKIKRNGSSKVNESQMKVVCSKPFLRQKNSNDTKSTSADTLMNRYPDIKPAKLPLHFKLNINGRKRL